METTAKNAEISKQIIENMIKTGSIKTAWDLVFGEGSHEAFVTDLYNELRK